MNDLKPVYCPQCGALYVSPPARTCVPCNAGKHMDAADVVLVPIEPAYPDTATEPEAALGDPPQY